MVMARHLGYDSVVEIIDHESSFSNTHDAPVFAKLPHPARAQIFGLGMEQFQQLEARILPEIDSLVFGEKSNRAWEVASSCSDPLILGLCIRRMALWYRYMMLQYKNGGISKRLES